MCNIYKTGCIIPSFRYRKLTRVCGNKSVGWKEGVGDSKLL